MIYVTGSHTGKGFITHEDSETFSITKPSNRVWKIDNTSASQSWASRNNLTEITLAAARSQKRIEVDAYIAVYQDERTIKEPDESPTYIEIY